MKRTILIFLLFLLFFQIGWTQEEPQLQKYITYLDNLLYPTYGTSVIKTNDFKYDNSGNLMENVEKEYSYFTGGVVNWTGHFYEYDSNNQLTKDSYRRYNKDVDLWITIKWFDYEYNENGCLVAETRTTNIGGAKEIKIYERNEDCQINSLIIKWQLSSTGGIKCISFHQWEYFADAISFEKKSFWIEYDIIDTIDLYAIYQEEYNEHQKLKERFQIHMDSNIDTAIQFKEVYDYDEFGNEISNKIYSRTPNSIDWHTLIDWISFNTYDEFDFLIAKRKERINNDFTPYTIIESHEITYEKSCEDLEEFRVEHNIMEEEIYSFESIYSGENKCLDIENIDLEIFTYPNPSGGKFSINSPIFQTGNTEILVFSTDGKVLLQKTEVSRSESSSLDLSFLQNGFYILQLRNGNHFVKEKIVIAK